MALLKNRIIPEIPELWCMDDVVERELRWLWYPYIPIGVATVIAGRGGIGKSTLACNIAAAITTGQPLPGQHVAGKPQNVLMLSAEDDYGAILRPRLRVAGADLKKIFVPGGKFTLEGRGFEYISEYIRRCGVAIAFIDPLVAWMGGKVDMNRMNEVRAITGKLHSIAEETGTAVVVVHHVRKGGNGEHWEQVAGSGDVVNAARSCLLVSQNKMGETFAHHFKHNYSPAGDDLYFTVQNGVFSFTDGPAAEGLEPGTPGRAPKAVIAAISFIRAILQDGPVAATEVEERAFDNGIGKRTLNKAKKGIAESYCKRVDGKLTWFWRLLGTAAQAPEKHDDGADIQGMADEGHDDVPDRGVGVGGTEDAALRPDVGGMPVVAAGSEPDAAPKRQEALTTAQMPKSQTPIRDFAAEIADMLDRNL